MAQYYLKNKWHNIILKMQSTKLINVTSIATAYTTGRIHNICRHNIMTSHTNKFIQADTSDWY